MALRFSLGLACVLVGPGFAAPSSANGIAIDSCGPTFSEIYDFQAGQIMQYVQTITQNGSQAETFTSERKYRIVSREALSKGYRYVVDGLIRNSSRSHYPMSPAPRPVTYAQTRETWEFLDSARSAVNACPDRVVRFPDISSPYFTRVKIGIGDKRGFPLSADSTRIKILGADKSATGGNNLYSDSAGKKPLPISGALYYFDVYAAGLGRVIQDGFSFESGSNLRLVGYVRGKDTVGTVVPDTAYPFPSSARRDALPGRRGSDREGSLPARGIVPDPDGTGYRDVKGAFIPPTPAASLRPTP